MEKNTIAKVLGMTSDETAISLPKRSRILCPCFRTKFLLYSRLNDTLLAAIVCVKTQVNRIAFQSVRMSSQV